MLFKILKFSSFIILTVIFILSGVLLYHFQSTSASGTAYKIGGWLWSDSYGWISLSSDNCVLANNNNPNACTSGHDYQVIVTSTYEIIGYGWSQNVGWVCFGQGANSTTGCTTASFGSPPSGSLFSSISSSTDRVTGWAKVIAEPIGGWIKLGRGNSTTTFAKGEACYDCACTTSTDPCPAASYNCKFCFSNNCFSTTVGGTSPCPSGAKQPVSAVDPVSGGSGKIVSNCSLCQKESVVAPLDGYRIFCDKCNNTSSTAENYGLNRDPSDGYFVGWGWGGDYSSNTGPGWVHSGKSAALVYPWLETDYGSIYTYGGVRQRVKTPGKNATYCIFASSSLENVSSFNCNTDSIKQFNINFPSQDPSQSVYRNILGKIDIPGLITPVSMAWRNKYGNQVQTSTSSTFGYLTIWQSSIFNGLDNKVYFHDGDFDVLSDMVISNGTNGKLGNGLVYINGDLIIDGNIRYSTSSIPDGNLKKLASIAWVVRGDVRINPNVTDLAGAIISLGADSSTCQVIGGTSDYPKYDPAQKCGVIFSVKPTMADKSKPLTIYGLAIAKAFDFHRTYSNISQGSERVIYDGRLTANPPPGLKDLVEGLPVIRDFDIQQFK